MRGVAGVIEPRARPRAVSARMASPNVVRLSSGQRVGADDVHDGDSTGPSEGVVDSNNTAPLASASRRAHTPRRRAPSGSSRRSSRCWCCKLFESWWTLSLKQSWSAQSYSPSDHCAPLTTAPTGSLRWARWRRRARLSSKHWVRTARCCSSVGPALPRAASTAAASPASPLRLSMSWL